MTRRRRVPVVITAVIVAFLLTTSSAFAVVTHSYVSTWSQTTAQYSGTARVYSGHHINIQFNAGSTGNGTFTIEVFKEECAGPICVYTIVGGAGNCSYNGFCGLSWNIALDPNIKYGFRFRKPADGINVHSTNQVQMWSTEP
jgi:hypothetical protein